MTNDSHEPIKPTYKATDHKYKLAKMITELSRFGYGREQLILVANEAPNMDNFVPQLSLDSVGCLG